MLPSKVTLASMIASGTLNDFVGESSMLLRRCLYKSSSYPAKPLVTRCTVCQKREAFSPVMVAVQGFAEVGIMEFRCTSVDAMSLKAQLLWSVATALPAQGLQSLRSQAFSTRWPSISLGRHCGGLA